MSSVPVLATPPTRTDAEVIGAVLAGDRSQFATLVRRHNQAVFRACRAVLGEDTEAEDAVQTAWVNAFRALATFRADSTFRTWITRIAVNEASSRLRSRRRLQMVALEEHTMESPQDPAHEAYVEQLGRMLERQIDALPEGMRTVLVLRDVVELDTAETAGCLGIGEEAVRVRLHRARHALAKSISDTETDAVVKGTSQVWRFDGERCARVLAHVMAKLDALDG